MRAIDLNQRDRPEIEISLSGQTWRLRRVVMATYQLYQQLAAGADEAQSRAAQLQDHLAAGLADDDDAVALYREINDEIALRQELTYDAIESILIANGYEFDRRWWEENSDRHEQHAFIAAAINKDLQNIPAGKKKADG